MIKGIRYGVPDNKIGSAAFRTPDKGQWPFFGDIYRFVRDVGEVVSAGSCARYNALLFNPDEEGVAFQTGLNLVEWTIPDELLELCPVPFLIASFNANFGTIDSWVPLHLVQPGEVTVEFEAVSKNRPAAVIRARRLNTAVPYGVKMAALFLPFTRHDFVNGGTS